MLAGDCRIETGRGRGGLLPARGDHHGGTPIRKGWMKEDEEDEGEEVRQFEAYRER